MVAQKVIVLIFKKPKPTELKTARGRLMPPPSRSSICIRDLPALQTKFHFAGELTRPPVD